MSLFRPSLYFSYLAKLYIKNLLAILFGLSFAFAAIDYFQHVQQLKVSSNYKILYIFYTWEVALGLLYPLAIVFALIMTKLALVKNNTMGALHAFGYDKKRLFIPLSAVAFVTYLIFLALNSTEFSYAKDKASFIVDNEMGANAVDDLFFKYNDTFVYISKLDPIAKKISDITIFKVEGYQVLYTINAPIATFDGEKWTAHDATVKTHMYENGKLKKYVVEHKERIETLEGYKPKIIESLYAGKSLNIVDAYYTWILLDKQNLNSDKIRAAFYDKVVMPLSSMALLLILFFKLPFHARMMNIGAVVSLALGVTFMIWGALYGLSQIGLNGVLIPELTAVLPIVLLMSAAVYIYFTDERSLV
ncbi:LptF/LptG family permease [Sulfurovum sp.]|uniref:LptF/LptG family permease n=1 Tax=Sulfurovum sp. TaxID=1969726 RepID=UPI002867D313|nr:LptF/LptG family permease [Sulfurovum sp.]